MTPKKVSLDGALPSTFETEIEELNQNLERAEEVLRKGGTCARAEVEIQTKIVSFAKLDGIWSLCVGGIPFRNASIDMRALCAQALPELQIKLRQAHRDLCDRIKIVNADLRRFLDGK